MIIKRGIWIATMGIDGTGKTMICRYIMRLLDKEAEFMKIPYYDWVRDMIKISGNNSPNGDAYTDSLIFSAGNRLEMYKIRETLQKKRFLVTQRCWLDNFPYRIAQGFTMQQAIDLLKPEQFEKPDMIFFLKCDYKIAYNRIRNQRGDKYEEQNQMRLHEKEYENMFNNILNKKFPINLINTKIFTIDSSKSITQMKKEIREQLIKLKITVQDHKKFYKS
jgi:thymidylate kinase